MDYRFIDIWGIHFCCFIDYNSFTELVKRGSLMKLKTDSRTLEYYSLDPIPKIESEISFCNLIRDTNAVLGSFSAAHYVPTVRYKKVHVYVGQDALDDFFRQLDLQPVSSGGNVIITIPHDETPHMYARKINVRIPYAPHEEFTFPQAALSDSIDGIKNPETIAAATVSGVSASF